MKLFLCPVFLQKNHKCLTVDNNIENLIVSEKSFVYFASIQDLRLSKVVF